MDPMARRAFALMVCNFAVPIELSGSGGNSRRDGIYIIGPITAPS